MSALGTFQKLFDMIGGVRAKRDLTGGIGLWSGSTLLNRGKSKAYIGQVATRCGPPQNQNVAYKQLQGRSKHVAMDTLSSLQLVYSGWYITNPRGNSNISEVNASANLVVTAAIEYPIGTITQVTFSGAASGTITPGSNLISDPVAVEIPIGAAFYVRVFQTSESAILYIATSPLATFGESCNIAESGLTDLTMAGSITNTWSSIRFLPSAIIGQTTRPSFAIAGDSRAAGALDTCSDGYLLIGELERTVGKQFAYVSCANGGERVNDAAGGQFAKRAILAGYCSHVISNYGNNDLLAPRNTAQITADILTLRGILSGKPFIQCTVAPVSTSTDAWATTGNQTTFAYNAERIALNTSVRTCFTGSIDGFAEVSDAVETVRDSGIWKAPGYTTDGTHETQLACIAVQTYGGVADAVKAFA